MRTKLTLAVMVFLLLVAPSGLKAQDVALKTNLLYDATLTVLSLIHI